MAKKLEKEVDFVCEDIGGIIPLKSLEKPAIVPSCFVGLNRGLRTGGIPSGTVGAVYGPTQEGKTVFAAGILKSFLDSGNYGLYVDAEKTLDPEWAKMLGLPDNTPIFQPKGSYEETVITVGKAIEKFLKFKKTHEDKEFVLLVDTINRLVPKNELMNMAKDEIKRTFSLRPYFNQLFIDKVLSYCGGGGVSLVLVCQERVDRDAMASVSPGATKYMAEYKKFKPKGGQAVTFDASYIVRITEAAVIKEKIDGTNFEIGVRHTGFVEKNKMGWRHEKFDFHTISRPLGDNVVGFDIVRDVVSESIRRDMLGKSESGRHELVVDENTKFETYDGILEGLRANPEALQKMICKLNDEIYLT